MVGEESWTDRAAEKAKDVVLTAGIVGAGLTAPFAGMQDPSLTDPAINSAIGAAASFSDAITSGMEGIGDAEDALDETDVDMSPTNSLMVDSSEYETFNIDAQGTVDEIDNSETELEISWGDEEADDTELEISWGDEATNDTEQTDALDSDLSEFDSDDADTDADVGSGVF
jgi:hypothetical protein